MDWFRRKMEGRYGFDQLSMALVVLALILAVVANFSRLTVFAVLSWLPLVACGYRMLSRNIERRRLENYKFMMALSPVYAAFQKRMNRMKSGKNYRYFNCPHCRQELRVPKGKGKITITCPKCAAKFQKKS